MTGRPALRIRIGVYRVIYADPPWEYGDKRTNDANSGSAESQYPTMPIDEICGLAVAEIAAADSVLFLWATAPLAGCSSS